MSTMPFARRIAARAAASTESSKSIVPTTSERLAGSATKGEAKSARLGPAVEVRRGGAGALHAPVEAAAGEHPLDLVGEQDQRRERRACCRSGPCASSRARSAARGRPGCQRSPAPSSSRDPLDRRRAEGGQPEAAVGAEGLLRGEVVDVGLGGVERQAAGAGGGVDEDERIAGALRAPHVDHDAGRGLVVRPGDRVGGGIGGRLGGVAGIGLDQDRVAEEGGAGRRLRELLRELAVDEVQRRARARARRRRRPRRRSCRRCRGRPRSRRAGRRARRCRRAPGRPGRGPASGDARSPSAPALSASLASASRAHLRGPAAEAAVLGLELGGDLRGGRNGHRSATGY